MSWFKKAQSLDDLFDFSPRKIAKTDPPRTESYTLTLYRGFDADLEGLEKSNDGYVLSPHKSEQGVMWFTHDLIRGYDAKEYVSGRGKYLLTYPLDCLRHLQTIHYEDGSSYDTTPQEILDKSEPTENCRFHAGFELPEGWFFSYKTEKFIVCTIPISVSPGMISLNEMQL